MKRLLRKATHDQGNRDYALAIINGKIYESNTHANCINQYLNEIEQQKLTSDWFRPDDEEIEDIDKLAFAHLVYYDQDLVIFLEEQTLKNMTMQEATDILKAKYPSSRIYNDDVYDDNSEDQDILYKLVAAKRKRG